jgi:hypothetical protein
VQSTKHTSYGGRGPRRRSQGKRIGLARLLTAGMAGLLVSSVLAFLGVAGPATVASAATSPVCNYTVTSGSGTVVSAGGATFIVGVAPGNTITVDCNSSSGAADAAEASLLAGIATTSVSATNEADTGTLTGLSTTTSTGCPAGTSCVSGTFTVANPFKATDSNAQCAPTQAQVNDGVLTCVLAVVNSSLAPVTEALLIYASTIASPPAAPTVTTTTSYALPGDTVSLSGGGWWAQAIQAIQAGELGTTAQSAPSTCGSGGGYGDVPNGVPPSPGFLEALFVPKSGTPVATSPTTVEISNDCYDGTTLFGPTLSGSVTVPSLSPGTYTIAICEVDPFQGIFNGNDTTGQCGTAPSGTSWITANTGSITVPTGQTATANPTVGSVGNAISVSGTGFDPQGGAVSVKFTSDTGTPTSSCNSVTATGTVSCSITVDSTAAAGSNPIVLTQTGAGTETLTASAPFTVSTLSLHCTILDNATFTAPTSCDPQQVISDVVSGNTAIGITISETTPFVTLNPVTLDGQNQTTTGAINELTVNDSTGVQPGWTVTAAFESNNFACGATSGASGAQCSGIQADNVIPISYFGWTPSLDLSGTTSNVNGGGITAGAAVTPADFGPQGALPSSGGFYGQVNPTPGGADTTNGETLCSAGVGNSGGITLCDANVSLGIPAYVSQGTYSNTLDFTLSAG